MIRVIGTAGVVLIMLSGVARAQSVDSVRPQTEPSREETVHFLVGFGVHAFVPFDAAPAEAVPEKHSYPIRVDRVTSKGCVIGFVVDQDDNPDYSIIVDLATVDPLSVTSVDRQLVMTSVAGGFPRYHISFHHGDPVVHEAWRSLPTLKLVFSSAENAQRYARAVQHGAKECGANVSPF